MTEPQSLTQRVDALEMRVAYQDQTIEELSATIADQWKRIEELTAQIARLADEVREVENIEAVPDEERLPPHY